jgi:hypothetical protein
MNVFDKALKSFNTRAVLQKAALGKLEGSWVNIAGQNVLPPVSWDVVVGPGIALTYDDAFRILHVHLFVKLKNDGHGHIGLISGRTDPRYHSRSLRKLVAPYIQELLVECADQLAPYFGEKFNTTF